MYCSGNSVNRIDPDGKDYYRMDGNGKKHIIVLLVGFTFITSACAQVKKIALKFYPKGSIEDVIDNDNSSEKTRMDSLIIIDTRMNSIFAFILDLTY